MTNSTTSSSGTKKKREGNAREGGSIFEECDTFKNTCLGRIESQKQKRHRGSSKRMLATLTSECDLKNSELVREFKKTRASRASPPLVLAAASMSRAPRSVATPTRVLEFVKLILRPWRSQSKYFGGMRKASPRSVYSFFRFTAWCLWM